MKFKPLLNQAGSDLNGLGRDVAPCERQFPLILLTLLRIDGNYISHVSLQAVCCYSPEGQICHCYQVYFVEWVGHNWEELRTEMNGKIAY